jgi:hypothetical protein
VVVAVVAVVQTDYQVVQAEAAQLQLVLLLVVLGLRGKDMQVVAVTILHTVAAAAVVERALLVALQTQAVHQQVMVVLALQVQ